jgi:hypothetical protein
MLYRDLNDVHFKMAVATPRKRSGLSDPARCILEMHKTVNLAQILQFFADDLYFHTCLLRLLLRAAWYSIKRVKGSILFLWSTFYSLHKVKVALWGHRLKLNCGI